MIAAEVLSVVMKSDNFFPQGDNMAEDMDIKSTEGVFEAGDGMKLFERWWTPAVEPKGVVVIVHGFAEHSGRYIHVGGYLSRHGFAAGALDLRGHGRSEGKRVRMKSFDEYLSDVDTFLERARQRFPGKTIFLLGHSMGGGVVTLYCITRQPGEIRGVVLSGAMLKLGDDISPSMAKLVGLLAKIAPGMPTVKLDGTSVSRDPEVVKLYDSDPLNYRGATPAHTAAEFARTMQCIKTNMPEFRLPVFILYGSADRLVDPEGSKQLYEKASSTDKTIKGYEGFYHEIMNEPEKEQVLGDILAWLEAHLN
jgi:acylglycerol lipase